jgi:phosphatidylserine decarboxylase
MSDRLAVLPQYFLPKQALTALAGRFARAEGGSLTHAAIRRFVARYGVNMAEAAQPDITAYATFNEFFTRPLRDGARPLAQATFVCPVDGAISQFGPIEKDQIFQAKGHSYSTTALVGGDAPLAAGTPPRSQSCAACGCAAGPVFPIPSFAQALDGAQADRRPIRCWLTRSR